MIRNYLTIACRNLLRNKAFSAINILGLALGMTTCLFVFQYVYFERSYDNFHAQAGNIYRVTMDRYVNGEFKFESAKTYPAIAPRLAENFGEIINYVRLLPDHGIIAEESADRRHYEDRILLADAAFFNVFSFNLLKGERNQVLKVPNAVVLSTSTAAKYFGEKEAVGKTLHFYKDDGTQEAYKVTGVFEDVPANSHLRFDILFSYSTLLQRHGRTNTDWRPSEDSWQVDDYYTYVLLDKNARPAALEQKLPDFFNRYKGDLFKSRNVLEILHLQPLRQIHLYSDLQHEMGVTGNYRFVYALQWIAILIIVIAWINYVNLATAKASERAREVGIRKVFGSRRKQLVSQFLFESMLTNAMAFALSVALYEVTAPFFQSLSGSTPPAGIQAKIAGLALMVFLSLAGVALASLYPALLLSGFKPIMALKGKITTPHHGISLRKSLVLFQFLMAILMIAGVLTIRRQINFMKNSNLGFEVEKLVVVKAATYLKEGTEQAYEKSAVSFKHRLLQHPQIDNVTESGFVPGQEIAWRQGMVKRVYGSPEDATDTYHVFAVDEHFFETYGMKAAAGKVFNLDFSPGDVVVINETAAQHLGFAKASDAIGEEIFVSIDGRDKARISGVVKDYHHLSLKHQFQPQIFFYRAATWSYFTVKITGKDLPAEIDIIRKAYTSAFTNNPFDYFFLDSYFDAQYQADQRFEKVFGLFSALAIFISCIGLFGLSSYTVVQRTKEIGIHKVLGATAGNIIALLSKELIRLVVIAGVLALPLSYAGIRFWLDSYAFRIDITWWLLAAPVALALVLALITISIQTIRTSITSAALSLRHE